MQIELELNQKEPIFSNLVCVNFQNVVMDRRWMKAYWLSAEYDNGVTEFLQFAEKNLPNTEGIFPCPCVSCGNRDPKLSKKEIRGHLVLVGICQNYTQWIWHGETMMPSVSQREEGSVDMDDRLEDMIRNVGEESFKKAHVYDNLRKDKEQPLYPGCTKFSRLSAVLRLFNLKEKMDGVIKVSLNCFNC